MMSNVGCLCRSSRRQTVLTDARPTPKFRQPSRRSVVCRGLQFLTWSQFRNFSTTRKPSTFQSRPWIWKSANRSFRCQQPSACSGTAEPTGSRHGAAWRTIVAEPRQTAPRMSKNIDDWRQNLLRLLRARITTIPRGALWAEVRSRRGTTYRLMK